MTEIKRVRDWRSRLSTVIEDRRRVPYSDINNCGLFLADCVAAMTGVDLAKTYRGQFKTLAEAIVLLKRSGYEDLPAFLADHLTEIHPTRAVSGDIAILDVAGGWAGGIVSGERLIVMGEKGQGTVSRTQATRAFRIP